MAKSGKPTDKIQELLEEKQRIERWLDRLDSAADQTSAEVRSKVTQDYQARLDRVVQELQGHRDDLAQALTEQQEQRSALEEEEKAASERLAEAELRHAVGEYDEATWSKLRTEIVESLVAVRENLKEVRGEIDKLDEVIRLIDRPAPAAEDAPERQEPPEAGPEPEPAAEPAASVAEPSAEHDAVDASPAVEPDRKSLEVPELPEEPSASEPEAEPEKERRSEGFDELAFLKSVTDEQAEAGGAGGRVDKAKKTLVCSECGANNLPTEWYCERCGAELAAL